MDEIVKKFGELCLQLDDVKCMFTDLLSEEIRERSVNTSDANAERKSCKRRPPPPPPPPSLKSRPALFAQHEKQGVQKVDVCMQKPVVHLEADQDLGSPDKPQIRRKVLVPPPPPGPLRRTPKVLEHNSSNGQLTNRDELDQETDVTRILFFPRKPKNPDCLLRQVENFNNRESVPSASNPEVKTESEITNQVRAVKMEKKRIHRDFSRIYIPPPLVKSLPFNLKDLLRQSKQGTDAVVKTELEYEISRLDRPIGLTVLKNGTVVVGVSGLCQVRLYDGNGRFVKNIKPGREFHRPTDMISIPDGRIAIRDDVGIQIFNESGEFEKDLGGDILAKCFGIAAFGQNELVAINYGRRSSKSPTFPGATDLVFINLQTDKLTRRIELAKVIRNSENSKCRFLCCKDSNVFVGDLGLDVIYCVDAKTGSAKVFGGPGRAGGKFGDPAGMAVDDFGNMIIADAKNNRLQVLDSEHRYLGVVETPSRLNRPSGIFLSPDSKCLFVLNLHSNNLLKLKFSI